MTALAGVVIVGAGMGGLTTAAYLAQAGFDVHVFEQHTVPGGYISSFVRKGFTFPAGPTSFGSNGMVFPILKELGLEDKCSFVPIRHQLSWDDHDVPIWTPAQARDALTEAFPGEKRGLRKFFHWVTVGGRGFQDLNNSGLMLSGGKGILWRSLRLGLRNPLYPWATAVARNQTNRTLYARYIKNPRLLQMLGRLGYPVMDGWFTLGMWAAYLHDYYVPLGGMQALANTFVRFIQDHGGKLHLGQRVEQILVSNGAATGVRTEDGTEIRARWVVSACDLRRTFLDLIGRQDLSEGLIKKLESGMPSESIFTVFLGLDGSPELIRSLQRFQASHVCFTCAGGDYMNLVLLTKDDPSLAPPGKHALWIGRFSPYNEWEELPVEEYQQCKEEKARELIRQAEEFIPGLSHHIEVMETASPLTYERYTGNWRGAVAGWNSNPAGNPHFNFAEDVSLGNFYCVGHWVHSPAGVPAAMGTAWYIVREILKDC